MVDCKTVGFFLKISKEVGKAWRKSNTREPHTPFSASFQTFSVTAHAYLNTPKSADGQFFQVYIKMHVSDCVMQDVQPTVVSSFLVLRFRDLSASFSRFWGLRFRSRVLRFRSRVLRFRVLGAPFSSFGCFVLRSSFSSASFSKLPAQT